MPDDVALVELLHQDLRNVTWPEPEVIRATARRRSRRSAALAATYQRCTTSAPVIPRSV